LLEDDADLKLFRNIHKRYPSSDLLVVTFAPDQDLFSDQALETLGQLRDELEKVASVEAVFTILDGHLFKSSDEPFEKIIKDVHRLETPGVDRERAKQELLTSPVYRELIISADGQTTALLLRLVEDERYGELLHSRNDLRETREVTLTLRAHSGNNRYTTAAHHLHLCSFIRSDACAFHVCNDTNTNVPAFGT